VLAILSEFPEIPVIFHAFSGSAETARICLQHGGYLAFGGPLTFRNAGPSVEVAVQAPIERLLLETDAPLLSPEPYRGRRNEPARVGLVAERLAALRGTTVEAVAAATTANVRRLFSFPVEAPA
jgi:TatD DNase family protein